MADQKFKEYDNLSRKLRRDSHVVKEAEKKEDGSQITAELISSAAAGSSLADEAHHGLHNQWGHTKEESEERLRRGAEEYCDRSIFSFRLMEDIDEKQVRQDAIAHIEKLQELQDAAMAAREAEKED